MKRLLLQPSTTAHYYSLVNEAQANLALQLDEDLESYLVFLLMRYATKPEMAASILALEFLESITTSGSMQVEMLKDVGDKCLLYSGLFPERAKRRRVKASYYIDLGQNAYHFLSISSAKQIANLYSHLSESFLPMRNVLNAMRYDEENHLIWMGESSEFHADGNSTKH